MPTSAASTPTHHGGELIEIAPGRWRFARPSLPPARSDLPSPMIIRDEMEPTEQVDGRFYTSKAKFRAVGRSSRPDRGWQREDAPEGARDRLSC